MLVKINRIFNTIYFGAVARAVFSQKLSTFSAHPICMSVAWFYVCEGVLAFRKSKEPDSMKKKVGRIDSHMSYMFIGMILAIVGSAFVYVSKEQSHMGHFLSIHGYAGFITVSLLAIDGVTASVTRNFNHGTKLSWTIHRLFGFFLILSIATISYLHIGHSEGYLVETFQKSVEITPKIGRISFIMSCLSLAGSLAV